MKTLKLFIAAGLLILLGSCSSNNADKVYEKIGKSEPLTEQDYGVMIDYVADFAQKAQKIQGEINNYASNSEEGMKAMTKLQDLVSEYKYYDLFSEKIVSCTQDEIGKENVDKINKYSELTWFVVPGWAVFETNPNVEGFIEETPTSDSDSEAIATGSGQIVK